MDMLFEARILPTKYIGDDSGNVYRAKWLHK